MDEPTTFWYDNKPYEPSNFKHEFHGTVTLRQALAKSMNVATVKVGEMVGFDTRGGSGQEGRLESTISIPRPRWRWALMK